MQIIDNQNNKTFRMLRVDKSKLTNKVSKNVVSSIDKLTQDLARSKFWDLAVNVDCEGNVYCEYINKSEAEHTYCDGVKNPQIENNKLSGSLFWVKKLSDGYKEYYVSFIDLTFKTFEQAKNALSLFNSPEKKSLEYEADVVKILDSADEIILDDTTHFVQNA